MLRDRANFQLKQVNKIVIGGRRRQMPRRFDLFGKQQAVEYLCAYWIDLTDSLPTLAGDDRLLIAAMKTWTNKAGKENRKFGAAVSHFAPSQPSLRLCRVLSCKAVGLRVPSLALPLLQLRTGSSGAQMLQAHLLSAPCPLRWHRYVRCKQEGTEISASLVASRAKNLSIQLCQWNICTQVLLPILPGWKRPCAHLCSLQVILGRMGTTVVPGCPAGGTPWGFSPSITSELEDKA